MTPKEYQALVKRMAPPSPIIRDTALAFLVGGGICVVGQLLSHWYGTLGLDTADAGTATSVTLVFLSALATGLGVYHKLARWAGAGAHHRLCQRRGVPRRGLPGGSSLYNWDSQRKPQSVSIRTEPDKICWEGGT